MTFAEKTPKSFLNIFTEYLSPDSVVAVSGLIQAERIISDGQHKVKVTNHSVEQEPIEGRKRIDNMKAFLALSSLFTIAFFVATIITSLFISTYKNG